MKQKTTKLLLAGRPKNGWVNTPAVRGSTYLFESYQQWRDVRARRESERLVSYGARGNETCHALEDALVELEGGYRASLYPTGQAAIATTLAGLLAPGDHVLVTDAVYDPVRNFCRQFLERMGVEVEFYLPSGEDIPNLLRPNTKLIYVESPGTATYDMVDLPWFCGLAKSVNALVVADNTWGSGWLYRPLELGADVSVIAATKYIGGHSDLVMGAVVANERAWPQIQKSSIVFGQTVSGDDAFMALRGVRTLALRMQKHGENALQLANWLQSRPEVSKVYFPALPDDPNHALWKRDCNGINGLLTVELHSRFGLAALETFMDALELFGLGSSWGGYESLVIPVELGKSRVRQQWSGHGPMFRLHAGLEDASDLIADLEQALGQMSSKTT